MNLLFRSIAAPLVGVKLLEPRRFSDERGSFIKTYHEAAWREAGIDFDMKEEYHSVSHRGVLRGMHFQTPPHDHAKVVYCPHGRVKDVLLDLRRNSPTFGQSLARELSAENRMIVVIPAGIAHGFLSLDENSILVYKTGTVHSPEHDAGIRWDSFGFEWGHSAPVVSSRDAAFPSFANFSSPFA